MIQRQTQNLAYWREAYTVDEADHEFLYEFLADAGKPQSLDTLAYHIIERRCAQEEARIRRELSRGLIYDPKESYQEGDEIVFPALGFRVGSVVALRPGENPEHGEFDVIRVRFADAKREKEFAARLATPHRLNRQDDSDLFADADLLSVDDLFAEVSDAVAARIYEHLQANGDYFINAGDKWLTTDQMVPVNIGHLNIAEAAIEVNEGPMTTTALLEMLDLEKSASAEVQAFSLETAMLQDERFVEVSIGGATAWYLRRLVPPETISIPPLLLHVPEAYDRNALEVELLQAEWELNDEWTDGGLAEGVTPGLKSATLHLIFPHWISGTLPLAPSTQGLLDIKPGKASLITLLDGRWGKRFEAWVVPEGRYIAGLAEWFKAHKLPVGARITLERSPDGDEIVIDYKPHRARRDWIRMARVEDDRLMFMMTRQQMLCEYDEHLAIGMTDIDSILALGDKVRASGMTIPELVAQIMPELVKLSPQGTAHVKTLYSAVNLLRRTPPGPIFAALTQLPTATDTGSGYWNL